MSRKPQTRDRDSSGTLPWSKVCKLTPRPVRKIGATPVRTRKSGRLGTLLRTRRMTPAAAEPRATRCAGGTRGPTRPTSTPPISPPIPAAVIHPSEDARVAVQDRPHEHDVERCKEPLPEHGQARDSEVGGGTGQVATVLAKAFDVSVFTLEPWHGGEDIQARAAAAGVGDRVVALTSTAQQLPFAANTFDAVLSINSFEMVGDERRAALAEMVRVARPGARVGIAEPMCLPAAIPAEIAELDERGHLRFQEFFRTVAWNRALFEDCGLRVTEGYYFPDARRWWLAYEAQATQPGRETERELILRDDGRWLSLGQVVGQKL